jgi:hypothetical protein
MLNKLRIKLLLILFFLAIITIIIVIVVPVKFPYKITTVGKILPAKSWIVSKGNSGQLISFVHDRKKGIVDNYSVKEFERGDDIRLLLNPEVRIGKIVNEQDTVGFIYSNEIEKQLALLMSELNVTKSSLEFNKSGEKESVIKEAEENLNYFLKQASEQKKILARQKALFEKNLVSKEEYELTLNQAELNDISIAIAKAKLESVSTGEKKEQIELINNQIKSLQKQIEVLKKRYGSYYLISPVNGVVSNLASGDTLFSISDNNDFVVMIPVKFSEVSYINDNAEIEIKLPQSSEKLKGKIIFTDNSALKLHNEQVIVSIASIETTDPLAYGLMIECIIDGGSASIYEHLKRLMSKNIF